MEHAGITNIWFILFFFFINLLFFLLYLKYPKSDHSKIQKKYGKEAKHEQYISTLMFLKDYTEQLRNHPSEFKPRVVKNSNDFIINRFSESRNRYNTNIIKNDILSKYNNIKTEIEQDYPTLFKGLSKNTTYEIAVYEINCLLNTFKSMQRPKE